MFHKFKTQSKRMSTLVYFSFLLAYMLEKIAKQDTYFTMTRDTQEKLYKYFKQSTNIVLLRLQWTSKIPLKYFPPFHVMYGTYHVYNYHMIYIIGWKKDTQYDDIFSCLSSPSMSVCMMRNNLTWHSLVSHECKHLKKRMLKNSFHFSLS